MFVRGREFAASFSHRMPSANTHDAITFLLAVPAAAAGYAATGEIAAATTIGVSVLFGGLMFGPDLDTLSRQYTRWSLFRVLWMPYRAFFRHRSRFSHGLVFGALLRVIYFLGVVSLLVLAVRYVYATYAGGELPGFAQIPAIARETGEALRAAFGEYFLFLVFVGLWIGAASHTVTDIVASYVKTGRVGKLL